jgi:hypothetical protein
MAVIGLILQDECRHTADCLLGARDNPGAGVRYVTYDLPVIRCVATSHVSVRAGFDGSSAAFANVLEA